MNIAKIKITYAAPSADGDATQESIFADVYDIESVGVVEAFADVAGVIRMSEFLVSIPDRFVSLCDVSAQLEDVRAFIEALISDTEKLRKPNVIAASIATPFVADGSIDAEAFKDGWVYFHVQTSCNWVGYRYESIGTSPPTIIFQTPTEE